ncbi:MAG: phosphotransferase [Methylophagaceae bacterium]
MVKYPLLSLAQQQHLPELLQANPLPKMFDDSTHQLWHCDTVEGEFMLKVCDGNAVTGSTFWQGMSLLFDVQLPAQLGEFERVYDLVRQNSPLTIPDYIASYSDNRNKQQRAFILTKMMPGSMIEPKDVDDAMVITLAKHLNQLHAQKETAWGRATAPKFAINDWSDRLQNTLKVLAEKQAIPEVILAEALAAAKAITPGYAVPMMLDLRWDQFLQEDGKLTTLVDLDAFVFAPKELELVLLEYLLTAEQAKVFISEYQHHIDLSQVRKPYRLLLFMMNILGEQEVVVWMKRDYCFKLSTGAIC